MSRKVLVRLCALLLVVLALWALIPRDDCSLFAANLFPNPPHVPEMKGLEYFDQAESSFAIPVTISLADAQAFVVSKAPATIPFHKERFHVGARHGLQVFGRVWYTPVSNYPFSMTQVLAGAKDGTKQKSDLWSR